MAKQVDFSWVDLPISERRIFDRLPLVLALCQVRFMPILRIDQYDFIAPFQEAIRTEYPVFSAVPAPPDIDVHIAGMAIPAPPLGSPSWQFADQSRLWTVTLSRDSIGLETRNYRNFGDFSQRLQRVLDALVEHIVPTLSSRLGLRFINELRPIVRSKVVTKSRDPQSSTVDWDRIVRLELLGVAGVPVFQKRVHQAIQQLVLHSPDGLGINILHGIIPGGSLVNPPSDKSSPNMPFYALDIDVFQEFPLRKEIAVNAAILSQRIDAFHTVISRVFRWALVDEYQNSL